MSSSLSNRVNLTAKRRRRGLTLIEAAMVLTILALVVAGVMLFYQNATNSQKLSAATAQVSQIQQVIRTAYSGQPSYTGLTALTIEKSLPKSMIGGTVAAPEIRNAFNGVVAVAPVAGGSQFSIQYASMPDEACIRMVSMDLGRSVVSTTINGTVQPVTPVPPGTAQTSCVNNANVVRWIFY